MVLFVAVSLAGSPHPAAVQHPTWQLSDAFVYPEIIDAPLTMVQQIVPLPDGSVLVSDEQDEGVLLVGRAGHLLRRIGRRGDGPGEFRSVGLITAFGDTIAVGDDVSRRISFFDFQGALVAQPVSTLRTGGPLTPAVAGVGRGRVPAVVAHYDTITNLWLEFGPAPNIQGGLSLIRTRLKWGSRRVVLALPLPGGGETILRNPFGGGDRVAAHPYGHGVAVVLDTPPTPQSGVIGVELLDFQGKRIWATTVPYKPQHLTEQMVVDWLNSHPVFDDLAQMGLVTRERAVAAARERFVAPAFLPPLATDGQPVPGFGSNAAFVGTSGDVWLRLWDGTWRVIDRTGVKAELVPPDATLLLAATDDHVWGVRKNEYDVPSIIRFKLKR